MIPFIPGIMPLTVGGGSLSGHTVRESRSINVLGSVSGSSSGNHRKSWSYTPKYARFEKACIGTKLWYRYGSRSGTDPKCSYLSLSGKSFLEI
jgi:hypothetical protein